MGILTSTLLSGNSLNLDNLSNDSYSHLFNYLDLDDILQLRSVSKKFYFIVKAYQITELSFVDDRNDCTYYNSHLYDFKDNWFSTTKPINFRNNLLVLPNLSLLINSSLDLHNLKYLRIKSDNPLSIKLDDLNRLTQLEILVLNGIRPCLNDQLRLSYLKALSLNFLFTDLRYNSLMIDCPRLHSLEVYTCILSIKNPLTIKYLKTDLNQKDMCKFRNLEYLELCDNIEENLLSDLAELNQLKKIRINQWDYNHIVKIRELLKSNDNLEVFLEGVKISKIEKLDEFKNCKGRSSFKFLLDNHEESDDDLNFVQHLQHFHLNYLLKLNCPSLFKEKYTNVQSMTIESFIDEEQLTNLIKKLPNLCNLVIFYFLKFNQRFYDQLPAISGSLIRLVLRRVKFDNQTLDFSFITNMHYLKCLYTDYDILNDENLAINKLKYLKVLEFRINFQIYYVTKTGRDRFVVENGVNLGLPDQENFSLRELFEHFRFLRYHK